MTDQESGSALRTKLEEALARASKLESLVATKVAGTYTYVKPEDLSGVDPDQIDAKAQEVEAARKAEADELLRKALAARGVAVDDLDTALSPLLQASQGASQQQDEAAARLASLGQLGGTPVQPRTPVPESAAEKIRAGLMAKPIK